MGRTKKILVLVEGLGDEAFTAPWQEMLSLRRRQPEWKQELGRALSRFGLDVWFCGLTDLKQLSKALGAVQPDIVFQYCEAILGRRGAEAQLVQLLESSGIPFTGEDSRLLKLCKNKHSLKKSVPSSVYASAKVLALPSVLLSKDESWQAIEAKVKRFAKSTATPKVLVKPNRGEASESLRVVGMDCSPDELKDFLNSLKVEGYQEAIAEPYIHGSDVTCGILRTARGIQVVGGFLIKPKNTDLKAQPFLYSSQLKFSAEQQKQRGLRYYHLEKNYPKIFQKVKKFSKAFGEEMAMQSYMRLDFRVDQLGTVYFLEANPNPSLGRGDELSLAAKYRGIEFDALIAQIIRNAYLASASVKQAA